MAQNVPRHEREAGTQRFVGPWGCDSRRRSQEWRHSVAQNVPRRGREAEMPRGGDVPRRGAKREPSGLRGLGVAIRGGGCRDGDVPCRRCPATRARSGNPAVCGALGLRFAAEVARVETFRGAECPATRARSGDAPWRRCPATRREVGAQRFAELRGSDSWRRRGMEMPCGAECPVARVRSGDAPWRRCPAKREPSGLRGLGVAIRGGGAGWALFWRRNRPLASRGCAMRRRWVGCRERARAVTA